MKSGTYLPSRKTKVNVHHYSSILCATSKKRTTTLIQVKTALSVGNTRFQHEMYQFLFALLFSPSFFVFIQLGIDPSDSSIPHVKVVQKLGAWAKANNRDNQSDPMQFDIASLIRR